MPHERFQSDDRAAGSAPDDAAPDAHDPAALQQARTLAYSFLARRDYAEAELRQRLLRRGVAATVAEHVLKTATDAGAAADPPARSAAE